jgi:hypothetical protein
MWVLYGQGKRGKRLAVLGVPASLLQLIAAGDHVMTLEQLFFDGSPLLRADGIALVQADSEAALRARFERLEVKIIRIDEVPGGKKWVSNLSGREGN